MMGVHIQKGRNVGRVSYFRPPKPFPVRLSSFHILVLAAHHTFLSSPKLVSNSPLAPCSTFFREPEPPVSSLQGPVHGLSEIHTNVLDPERFTHTFSTAYSYR